LKFGIYVHSKRPKISPNEILKVVESAVLSYSNRDPDTTYGYYSYLDRITVGKRNNNKSNKGAKFSDNKLGICHIIPTFLVRKPNLGYKKKTLVRGSDIRYTVPNQSIIKISLTRNADVRLYGTTENSRGIAITSDDEILIRPSRRTAKIIRLNYDRT